MPGTLKDQKFDALFEMFDREGQGYLTRERFFRFAEGIAGLPPRGDNANAAAVRAAFEKWWKLLVPSGGSSQDTRIDRQEFVARMGSLVSSPANLDDAVLAVPDALMRALDTDRSGTLSLAEYRRIYTHVGVDAEHCEEAFRRLDRDGDGAISHQEWRDALQEFFVSDDADAPGNQLLGPLRPPAG
ncbi:EF-hand domain-containing protein [Streptomyces sp. NPDC000151]|uniref:EF-hand domain-containing protein n=1 Tax=Streptomyces sp. NPDC000151 TaxID=3154244 RepID=UPI0033332097